MAKIYVTRHGETLFNVLRRTQGQCDSPLTQNGIEMAIHLGKYFEKEGIEFDHAYCSTSERTEDTLNYITNSSVAYTRSKKLKELAFGSLEGGDDDEVFRKYPNLNLSNYDELLGPYGLENTYSAFIRFDEILKDIAATDYKRVLVVTHGVVFANWISKKSKEMLDHYFALKNSESISMGNCDCVVFDYIDGEIKMIDYIDHRNAF